MSHILPHKAFLAGEVVEPDDLNQPFQEAAGKLAGRLNEHDVSVDLKTKVTVADEAYYDAHQIKRASSPSWTRAADAFALIGGVGDAVAPVTDTEGWQTLVDSGGSQAMSLSLTTGDDTLVMFGQMQHVAWKGVDTNTAAEIGSPLRLQYALRVDGALLDDTISGAAVYPDSPPQQWYRASPATGSTDYDYRHIQYLTGTLGLSHAVGAARIVRALPVVAGAHMVELVARRLPPADYKTDNSLTGATVQVFNRRLFVLRIKGAAPHSGSAPVVNIAAFEDGQVVAAADITTNAFTVLSGAANDLNNQHLERGIFRNQHLPSVVYGPVAQPITPGAPTAAFNGIYPGYGTNGAAWTVINDGAGTNLRITGPTAGEWRLDTNPGLFVVVANVELYDALWAPAAASIQGIVVLALRMTNSVGTVTVLGETEVYVNTHNPDPEVAATMRPVQIDVPLMWVIDSTLLAAADRRITRVEVVGTKWDGDGSGAQGVIDVRTQRGLIYGFALKGVYL